MNLSRCYRGSVDEKNTLMDRKAVENLLAKQKVARWIKKAVKHLSRRNLETLMDWDCNKIYGERKKEGLYRRESVKDLSRSCQAWRKTQRDECNKKATQPWSNQHIKLSKTSLKKKKAFIDPKHTHTLNKSNQFYISK